MPTEKLYVLAALGVGAGILGSKIAWAIQPSEIGDTLAHPLRLIAFWQGGLTLVGGLVLGFAAATIYARRARLAIRKTLDAAVLGLGPAVAIGRIGCYLTGLHPGKVTNLPWGIYLDGAVRHPIPLYESVLGVLLFALGLLLYRKRAPAGITAVSVAMTYLVFRSLLDQLRASGVDGPSVLVLGGFTLTQAVTVFVVPMLAILAWWLIRTRGGGASELRGGAAS